MNRNDRTDKPEAPNAGVTRRQALGRIAAATGAATLTFGAPGLLRAQTRDKTVVVVSGGGSYEEAFRKTVLDPFEKETGIKVVYRSPADAAPLRAQVDSGNVQWDAVELSIPAFRPDAAKYLEEIDYGVFSKETVDNFLPGGRTKYAAGSYVFSAVMGISLPDFPAGKPRPQNWAEFWDGKRFPGPRSLRTAAGGDPSTLTFALLAAGVPLDKIYPMDFDKAFASLDKLKPFVSKWWSVGAEPGQMLSDRQVAATSVWNGRVELLKKQGAQVDYIWNQGEMAPLHWVVPKNAPNKNAAMRFIAYACSAEAQARLNSIILYGPLNRKAFNYIEPALAATLPTAPQHADKQVLRDLAWLNTPTASGKTNTDIMIERWNKWVIS